MAKDIPSSVSDLFDVAQKTKTTPIDSQQRIIIQNIFDTQPEKKKLYLKKLGWETNPKDDNQIRPIGTTNDFVDIDPGVSAYFKKGGLTELVQDLGDISADVAVKGPAVGIGGLVGGLAGGAVGAGVGAAMAAPSGEALAPVTVPAGLAKGFSVGSGMGLLLGGMAGSKFVEFMKDKEAKDLLGDMLVSKDVNPDAAYQNTISVIEGMAPLIGKGVELGVKGAQAVSKKMTFDNIKKMASKLGNGMTPEIVEKIASNPKDWTPDKVEGATKSLTDQYKKLFGLMPGEKRPGDLADLPNDSVMKQAFLKLIGAQKQAITQLNANPNASFTANELIQPLSSKFDELHDKLLRNGVLSDEEQSAYKWLQSQIGEIKGAASKIAETSKNRVSLTVKPTEGEISKVALPFETAHTFIKKFQDDVFNAKVNGSNVLATAVGGGEGQLNDVIRKKAAAGGVDWQNQVQAPISNFIQKFDIAKDTVTPQSISSAMLSDPKSPNQAILQEGFKAVDELTGTSFSQSIKDGSLRSTVEQMYKNPGKAVGSGSLRAAEQAAIGQGRAQGTVSGAIKGATAGTVAGQALGHPFLGGVLGAGAGAVRGAVKGGQEAAQQAGELFDVPTMIRKLAEAKTGAEGAAQAFSQFSFAPKAGEALKLGTAAALTSQPVAEQASKFFPSIKKNEDVPESVRDLFGD